jgi:hypothetical protein
MIMHNGALYAVLNTSTGGGYAYSTGSGYAVAQTPVGVFHTFYAIDASDVDFLDQLWRPRFSSGGSPSTATGTCPPEPVSHGCVRVSDEAIDWIWAENLDPIGMEVWIYS